MKKTCIIFSIFCWPYLLSAQYLPDIVQLYTTFEKFSGEGKYLELAELLRKENRDFRAPYIFFEEAKLWGELGQPDKAADALLLAIQYGMTDPKILDAGALSQLSKAKKWPKIKKEVQKLKKELSNPNNFEVSTREANDFLNALKKAKADTARAHQYFTEMILNGSAAMKEYYIIRYGSVDNIVSTTLENYPQYYDYLLERLQPESLTSVREQTMKNMLRFHEYYPDAVFPKGYLMVGMLNSGGTLTNLGVYIGLDMYARSEDMPQEELNDWHKSVIGTAENLPGILTHELMHFQQNYRDTILDQHAVLSKVIGEGVCDFLVGLSVDFKDFKPINHDYFMENEAAILGWLKEDLYKTDLSRWMYNGNNAKDYPADLGYTAGYFICKSYFENASDKKKAVKELLTTESFKSILLGSRYAYLLK